MSAATVRAVLLDIEGTVYSGDGLVPGAAEALAWLRERDIPVRFVTNIDSRSPATIVDQLVDFGLDVSESEVFTPIAAARAALDGDHRARVYPLVNVAVHGLLGGLVTSPPYTHVLVGDCREVLSYEALDEAFRAVRDGAELVALQRSRYYKRADGDHIDAGAIVAALEHATGTQARVLGKPSTEFFALAAASAGVDVSQCLVLGDDALSDVAGGRAAGARSVQVRTGKFADQHADGVVDSTGEFIDSIAQLPGLIGGLHG
ncbi:TIGR01458 family HAD-type hydrolase [Haloechinothrix sp. YIM 98757]|uniref:Haloacid dehalogenase-like hydrolase domain-containing protein 2 n=1 Tax=Haloechinothrix aidingensis TaxID=2752311 RepID=A0A838A6J7_9PSEU|nr:TIGR01458 family HAD-type hydrolase [Haloechinothrix aidingensis]MBA0124535.1 TIGR01458 family HAD-type hydrolase [Haloechinothrix aidingensis]